MNSNRQGTAVVLKPDGTKQDLKHTPTLEEAQGIVGGYVQMVSRPYGQLLMDEDAKLKSPLPPVNAQATIIFWEHEAEAIIQKAIATGMPRNEAQEHLETMIEELPEERKQNVLRGNVILLTGGLKWT